MAVACGVLALCASAKTGYWTGGGTSGAWTDAANWADGVIPGRLGAPGDDAAVCRAIGVPLHWFDEIDGEAFAGRETCERMAAEFRRLKPRAIIVHSLIETHYDHMMSAAAALKAAQLAGLRPEIYFQEQDSQSRAFQSRYYVDVTALTARRREVISLWACQAGPEIAVRKIESSRVHARHVWGNVGRYAEVFGVFPGSVPNGRGIFDTLSGVSS